MNRTKLRIDHAAVTADEGASCEEGLPSAKTLDYLRRVLVRKYRIPAGDVEDVIDDAMVSYLAALAAGRRVREGLFFVIACRRACDELRRRSRVERIQVRLRAESSRPEIDRLETTFLVRAVRRASSGLARPERNRLERVVIFLAQGSSWAEACRSAGVPRGSQSRCRNLFRRCFSALKPRSIVTGRANRVASATRSGERGEPGPGAAYGLIDQRTV